MRVTSPGEFVLIAIESHERMISALEHHVRELLTITEIE